MLTQLFLAAFLAAPPALAEAGTRGGIDEETKP